MNKNKSQETKNNPEKDSLKKKSKVKLVKKIVTEKNIIKKASKLPSLRSLGVAKKNKLKKAESRFKEAWDREFLALKEVLEKTPSIQSIFGHEGIPKKIIDSDADGLPDVLEKKWHTNPHKADSDDDGLNDFEEIFVYGSDPNNPDTNENGILDGEEVRRGQDPSGSGTLVDFFIPTKNNNYHPHALSQRRLFFYGFSALLMKLVLVLTIIILPLEAYLAPGLASKEIKKIIELTNQLRQNLKVAPLVESEVLDQAAYEKAQDMLTRQYFAHLSPDNEGIAYWLAKEKYNFLVSGENLAMGYPDSADIVNAWMKSETHYRNLIDPDYSEIGVGSAIGLFENEETTFVAQFFANPESENSQLNEKVTAPKSTNQDKVFLASSDAGHDLESDSVKDDVDSAALQVLSASLVRATDTPMMTEKKIVERDIFSKTPEKKIGDNLSDTEEKSTTTKSKTVDLISPDIFYPKNGARDLREDWVVKVFAQDAETVVIYDNKKQVAVLIPVEGCVETILNFEEGQHTLSAKSVRENQTKDSKEVSISIDQSPPILDKKNSELLVSSNMASGQKIFLATAFLSSDAVEATVNFGNYQIPLKKESSNSEKWVGTLTVFDSENGEEFKTLIPATVKSRDDVGNVAVSDLSWKGIRPSKISHLSLYLFLKENANYYLSSMLNISSWFYKFILFIASLTLMLNIFIQIRKQHPHIIFKTFGLILLLIMLIIF